MLSLLVLMFGCGNAPDERRPEAGTEVAPDLTGLDFKYAAAPPIKTQASTRYLTSSGVVQTVPTLEPAKPRRQHLIVGFAADDPKGLMIGPDDFPAGEVRLVQTHPSRSVGLFEIGADVDVDDAVEALQASGRYRFVERNQSGRTHGTVDDPYRVLQWNLDTVDVERAWEHATGSDIVVAVIDSGVRDDGPDGLYRVSGGFDFIDFDYDATQDTCSHGTGVAGTIAQRSNNGIDLAGIAHHATIMPYRVADWREDAEGEVRCVVDLWATILAVGNAVHSGAHVINMSIGFLAPSPYLEFVLLEARWAGVVVVASAGNEGDTTVQYPAAYDGVISVGAVDFNNVLTDESSYGVHQDLVAPGGDLNADENGDGLRDAIFQENYYEGYGWFVDPMVGTSMAAPHVAASAALLMSVCATSSEAEDFLLATALDLGDDGDDNMYGAGLLQTGAAVETFLQYTDLDGDGYADPMSSEDIGVFCDRPPSPACAADFNGDGHVDTEDYTIWDANRDCTDCDQSQGDASGDGVVDSEDYDLWIGFFNQACYD